MAAITASLVKELRERTGLGMMDCKKALVAADGNIETAIDELRKSGQAKAAKKAGRTAAEGAVVTKVAADGTRAIILEVNSETDFVARDENFTTYVTSVADKIFETGETDIAKLMEGELETARLALVQKIGENISVRRASVSEGSVVDGYIHGGRIGVLVALEGGDQALAKDVAMHVAAANPLVVFPEEVPEATLAREKDIFTAQAKESGKPDEIIEKMIVGRVKKFLKEVSLVEQSFIKDPDITVGALVKKAGATIKSVVRFEVGEGIEKEEVDFAAEVAAAAKG